MGGLYDLSCSELKDQVNSEDNLEEGKGFRNQMIFKDVLTPYSKEGGELQGVGEEVRMVKGGVGERSRDVGMLDSSEVPEPPKVESRIRERRVGEGEVPQSGVEKIGSRSAHCQARSKGKGGNSSEDLLKHQTSSLYSRCRGLVPQ